MAPPIRKCLHPPCRNFIPFTQSHCEKHEPNKAYDKVKKKSNPEYVRFYTSKAWRSARRVAMLRDNNVCVRCMQDGIYKSADMVDHVIPTLEDWERRLDQTNLMSLCFACHNTKTFKK